MRIAFLGKGGSGKTTLSAAFATYLNEQQKNVLIVDADVNVHVNRIIGIEEKDLKPISRNMNGIVNYVKGERSDLGDAPFISATPPSKGSRFITLNKDDELLKESTVSNKEGLKLMTIGTYEGSDIGFTCYHGKTDAFIVLLNHLLDKTNDYLVVDSVTGIDNLGNPLIYSYDLNVIVVEPTKKSIQVYKDFIQGIERFNYPINIAVIGNKVETREGEEFIKENINEEHLLGFVNKSEEMKSFDQGSSDDFKKFVSANSEIFNIILKELNSKQRDWDLYLKNIRANFSQMAQGYYNSYYNVDLESRVDNTFSFKSVFSMYQSIKPYIHYKLKEIVEAKSKLFEISKLHNGPIHILMPEIMDENINEFKKTFEELGVDYDIRFAHKTNKSPALVRQAKLNRINIDVASYNELVSALSNGFVGKEISCSGPKGKRFLLLALQHNCLISIDSVNELETIIELSKKYNILSVDIVLRINDLSGSDRTLLKKNTKFGISQNVLDEIKNLIKENSFINLKGIHFHFDEFQSEIKAGSIDNVLDIFQQLYSEGFSPTVIDIGGGFRGRELEDKGDWEKYIDFLSDSKRNNSPNDTWGNRAYGIHLNDRGGIEGREIVTKRFRELNNGEFLKSILTKEFADNQPIYKKISESLFKVMIEPGYSLSINTGFTILKVESYKTLGNGDEAITVNANILNLSSRMWEYYLDPILVAKVENNDNDFYGYIIGNLCRDDDVLIQRKVHFNQKPKAGDLILLMNTSSYISDFEDGNPIQQELGKKFIAKNINNSIEIFDENSSELI